METANQATPPTAGPTPCCPPKHKALCVLAALVFALLLGLSGFFLGQRSASPKSTPLPTPTPTPTIITDGTASWKMYRNEIMGLEIKYPETWFVNDNYPIIYLAKQRVTSEEMNTLTHGYPGSLEIIAYSDQEKINAFTKGYNSGKTIDGKEYSRVSKIKIGNKEAYKTVQFAEGDMTSVGGYKTTINFLNKGLLISVSYPNEYNQNYDYQIYEKEISSLSLFD